MGGDIWTDPVRDEYYQTWNDRLEKGNITHCERLPNDQVQKLLREAHFCLLPTFGDTFGYSAIEAMVNYCPMIATRQGALPEFIEDDRNGILLDLPVDADGQWVHIASSDRDTKDFERMFTDEIERLAHSALERIVGYLNDPARYQALRTEARRTIEAKFAAADANEFWDRRYEQAVG
jgi:glycosyltransferase involved in cell wall biosynthesis